MKTAALVCLSLVAAETVAAQSAVGNLPSLEFWNAAQAPFSFKYDGAESARILPSWRRSQESPSADVHRYIYLDPKTHLRITADIRTYSDFPGAVDWGYFCPTPRKGKISGIWSKRDEIACEWRW